MKDKFLNDFPEFKNKTPKLGVTCEECHIEVEKWLNSLSYEQKKEMRLNVINQVDDPLLKGELMKDFLQIYGN